MTVRPLTTSRAARSFLRTNIQHFKLQSASAATYWIWLVNLCLAATLLLFTQQYEWNYSRSQIHLTEAYWLYLATWWYLLSAVWYVVATRAALERIVHDHLIALLIIVLSIQLYYALTNLWALVVLLEIQGAALLLLIDLDRVNYKIMPRAVHAHHLSLQNIPIATALLLQFWVGFLGAILLLLAGGFIIQLTGATHWRDVVILLYFKRVTSASAFLGSVLSLLIVSLFLKIGSAPFHIWKPDLYSSLRLLNVFIYAVPYAGAVAFVVIYIIHILLLSAQAWTTTLLYASALATVYLTLSLVFATTSTKNFIAYTSSLHAIYLYLAPTVDRWHSALALAYNIHYISALLLFFISLFMFKHVSVSYLTDFQLYSLTPQKVWLPATALATMAGVPPLAGFWLKFSILYNLWLNSRWLLALHLLSASMLYLYFYVAIYRFTGATNFAVCARRAQLLNAPTLSHLGILLSLLIISSTWLLADFSNWTVFFAQQLYTNY